MKLKTLLLATGLVFATGAAMATDLVSTNSTGLYSTVKSPIGCATKHDSTAWTGPNQTSTTTDWTKVKLMCMNRFPCKATLYVGSDPSVKNCSTPDGTITQNVTIESSGNVGPDSAIFMVNGKTVKMSGGDHVMGISLVD